MKTTISIFLLIILPCLNLQATPVKDMAHLVSISFYEVTTVWRKHTFGINSSELTTRLAGNLNGQNRDFEGWPGNEFYDVYYSNLDGTFNEDGEFISIECEFKPTTTSGGLNIAAVIFNFADGDSIFASTVVSRFANGSNYIPGSEIFVADCDLNTLSTMGNNSGTSTRLRVTVGMDLTYSEYNYTGCTGDGFSLSLNNTIYNEQNPTGTEMLTARNGCDSLVNINLTFGNQISDTLLYVGCINDGFSISKNNTIYNEQNPTGTELLSSLNGCDTLLLISLQFEDPYIDTLQYEGCENDGYSITINNTRYDYQNPVGVEVLPHASTGCDSTIYINLSFGRSGSDSVSYSGCAGDGYSVLVNGMRYDEQNSVGIERIATSSVCDSTVYVNLRYQTAYSDTFYYEGCVNDGFEMLVNNTLYNELNPVGTEILFTGAACDSTIYVNFNYRPCSLGAELCPLFVPTAFTPNDDGTNEYFEVVYDRSCPLSFFQVKIFNRWGTLIYTSDQPDFLWDGTYKQHPPIEGVYVWLVEYAFAEVGIPVIKSGTVTIIK